jgi:hypothetical protein
MPQQIAKTEIVSPLVATVLNHVKMIGSNVLGRIHNKIGATCITMVAPVTIADTGQPVD